MPRPLVRFHLIAPDFDPGGMCGYVEHVDGEYRATMFVTSGVDLAQFARFAQACAARHQLGDIEGRWELRGTVHPHPLCRVYQYDGADFTVPDTVPAWML